MGISSVFMKYAYLVGVSHYSGSLAYGVELWEKSLLWELWAPVTRLMQV